ncbi:MAG: hemolysin family protein [Bdellovibrionia bacterium]
MNLTSILPVALGTLPLLLIEGFFSGAEIALLSADKIQLNALSKKGNFKAALALHLASRPEKVFATTLFMTNLCIIGNSAFIAFYLIEKQVRHANLLAILITSPLVVILGELIPKTLFQRNATQLAPHLAIPVNWAYWVFYPFTRLLGSYTTSLSRIVGPIEALLSGKRKNSRDEIRSLLSYSKEETDITSTEKRMIKRILDFRSTEARHALIPLVKVDAIEDSATVTEALEKFERHRHSRMPVYSERIDNIIGILESQDLLAASDLNQSIRLYITPAHYVSETQFLDDLIQELKEEDSSMLVVVDEHGGAVGILTFEDIVEEIVGEISDEYDYESVPYKEVDATTWSVQARMEISQINEILKLEIPQGNYETLGGFLLQQFGRIPDTRDELFFDTPAGSYRFTIQKATPRQIETVLIKKIQT